MFTLQHKFDRLALFSFAYAVANVFHLFSFPELLVPGHVFYWLNLCFAALVIFNPYSLYAFTLMLICSIIKTFQWMPFTPNHILFEWIINLGILTAITTFLLRKKGTADPEAGNEINRNKLFETFAPLARIGLAILYFYAVLHKLNWDYFNPTISCGPSLLDGFGNRLPKSIVENHFLRSFAVWGTLITELAIPILLFVWQTRFAGILLGLGFHFFLAIHPHAGLYSFSSLLFSLYTLFLPADFPEKTKAFVVRTTERVWPNSEGVWKAAPPILVVILLALIITGTISWHAGERIGFLLWLGWGLLCILVFCSVTVKNNFLKEPAQRLYRFSMPALALFPILIFINGMSPYLGLKTQTSFSMFSNLRTEGGITNHLFIPVSLHLTNMEEDLVDIVDSDNPELQEYVTHQQLMTFFEFRRIVSTASKDFFVVYKRNGQEQKLTVKNGVSSAPVITTPMNLLTYKFIRFRPIDKGACLCKH